MTMDNVRLASADDIQALSFILLKMMNERGVESPVAGDQMVKHLAQDGPGGNNLFNCLIAFHRMRPSGLLLYTPAYDLCTLSRFAQVHNLFVSEQAQGNGLKSDLLTYFTHLALEQHWSHVDWLVPRTELETVKYFQKNLGLPCEHVGFKMERSHLEKMARAQAA